MGVTGWVKLESALRSRKATQPAPDLLFTECHIGFSAEYCTQTFQLVPAMPLQHK